jgi:hypothetical protein
LRYHFQSIHIQPVFESFESDAAVVGFVVAVFPWHSYFDNILPNGTIGVTVVIDDQCGAVFTYEINGANSHFLGRHDLHENGYSSNMYSIDFATFSQYGGEHAPVNGIS